MFSVVRKKVAFFLDVFFWKRVTHSDFVLVDSLGIKVVSLDVVNPLAKPLLFFGADANLTFHLLIALGLPGLVQSLVVQLAMLPSFVYNFFFLMVSSKRSN